jgi:ribosomal protein S18 acetylase RimI-like enzyme
MAFGGVEPTSTTKQDGSGTATINIRDATIADAHAIAKLGSTVFASSFAFSMPEQDMQAYLNTAYAPSTISNEIKSEACHFSVACTSSGPVIGFLQLTRGSSEPCIAHLQNYIELQRLYIDPAHHGTGVAKALVVKAEDLARNDHRAEYMWLGVWEENHKAQRFYRKMGFEKVGHHDFVMGDTVQTDYILFKRL